MTGTDDHIPPVTPADAELADAMGSIQAIGEDWRSRERAIDDHGLDDAGASDDADASGEKEDDHG